MSSFLRKSIAGLMLAAFAVPASLQEVSTRQAIHLASGKLFIDGQQQPGSYSVSQNHFRFLYVYVPSRGLFIVSNSPFSGAVNAGSFADRKLEFRIGGIDFKLVSQTSIMSESAEPAWVRFDHTFNLNTQSIMFGYGDTESAPYDWPKQIGKHSEG